MSKVKVSQFKSRNGCDKPQLATLESLGLRKIGQTVEHDDTPQLRGMIRRVAHLVKVEED
jgi:large subunit ribosomal protein L30